MKQALCIPKMAVMETLLRGEIKTIDAQLVSREICEVPDNNYEQLIPYVVFTTNDIQEGRMKFIQYQRPSKGEGEERLQGKTSVGFGGHIDSRDDIVYQSSLVEKDGSEEFVMTLQDLYHTVLNCANREIKEELGIDLSELDIDLDHSYKSFFKADESIEVNKVHTGLLILVNLEQDKFNLILEKAQPNKEEIEELNFLGINTALMLKDALSGDMSEVSNNLIRHLDEDCNMEQWSTFLVEMIARSTITHMLSNIEYQDIIAINRFKQHQAEQQAAQQQPQVADEATLDTATASNDEGQAQVQVQETNQS